MHRLGRPQTSLMEKALSEIDSSSDTPRSSPARPARRSPQVDKDMPVEMAYFGSTK
jgi:hypothetical protein